MSDIQTFQASGTRDICASSAVRTRVLCVALSTCSFPLNQPEAEAEAAHDSGLAVERSGSVYAGRGTCYLGESHGPREF